MRTFVIYDPATGHILKTLRMAVEDAVAAQAVAANTPAGMQSIEVPDGVDVTNQGAWKVSSNALVQKTLLSLGVTAIAGLLTITLTPSGPGAKVMVQPGAVVAPVAAGGGSAQVQFSTGIAGYVYIDPADTAYYASGVRFST